jgi:hypothetical protein
MHRDHAVRPVTAAHCIRWSVVGCVACCTSCVVRRIDCCIVVKTKHAHHSRAPERRRGFSWMLHTHRMRSIPHRRRERFPNAPMPRKPSCRRLMLHGCVLCFVEPTIPSRAMAHRRVVRCAACCAGAARLGEGRAVAAAERRRDALVRSPTAACCPWTRAPRCSTPWRYPAPQQRRVRG